MNLLLWREVRRQAVAAAGMLGLAVVLLGLNEVMALFQNGDKVPPSVVLGLLGFATPWLLGSMLVAAERETGADAFLLVQPLSAGRLLALRAGVAVAMWALTVLLPFFAGALLFAERDANLGPLDDALAGLLALLVSGAVAFAAALTASITVRSTLTAFLVAPAMLLPLGLALAALDALHAPEPYGIAAAAAGALALAIAGPVAYARRGAERDLQPARRTVALVLAAGPALLVLLAGVGYARQALGPWQRFVAGQGLLAPDGSYACLPVTEHPRTQWSTWFEGREAGSVVFALADLDPSWTLPAGQRPLGFSPDGAWLLALSNGQRRPQRICTAFDAATGEGVERWTVPPELTSPRRPPWKRDALRLEDPDLDERWMRWPLVWEGRDPWLVCDARLVRLADGARCEWPQGWSLQAVGARRALLAGPDGMLAAVGPQGLDRALLEPLRAAAPGLDRGDLTLDPTGRWLLALAPDPAGAPALCLSDLEAGGALARLPIELPAADDRSELLVTVHWGGERATLAVRTSRPLALTLWVVDLPTGRAVRLGQEDGDELGRVEVLGVTPSGRGVLTRERWYDVSDLEAPVSSAAAAPWSPGMLVLDGRRGLRAWDPLPEDESGPLAPWSF